MRNAWFFCLLLAESVVADNDTWSALPEFGRHRRRQIGLPQGLAPAPGVSLDESASRTADPATTPNAVSIIDQRPRPTVTTSYGTFDLKTILPQIPVSLYPEISSLYSCDQANEQYLTSSPGTSVGTYSIPVPAQLRGIETILVENEYRSTGCDGVPRVMFTGGTPSGLNPTISPYTIPASAIIGSDLTWTNPPCTLDQTKFASYCSLYPTITQQLKGVYSSASATGTIYDDIQFYLANPDICSYQPDLPSLNPTDCGFDVMEARLLFWPESEYQNATLPCAAQPLANVSSITQAPEGEIVTAVVDGYTLTSPTVYVQYVGLSYSYYSGNMSTIWAKDATIFDFDRDSVSTVCNDKTVPINYRDLYDPIPWTAWSCAKSCTALETTPPPLPSIGLQATLLGPCNSIDTFRDTYDPKLAWPSQFSSVLSSLNTKDPQLCPIGFLQNGIYDPPRTLTGTTALTKPNPAPSPVTTQPAAVTLDPAAPWTPPDHPATITSAPYTPSAAKPAGPIQTSAGLGPIISSLINQPPAASPARPAPVPAPAPISLAPFPSTTSAAREPVPSSVIIGSSTVPVGGVATLPGGAVVTAGPSAIQVGGSTIRIPPAGTTQVALPGGSSLPVGFVPPVPAIAIPSTPVAISIGGQLVPIGATATLSGGQVVTALPNGIQAVGSSVAWFPAVEQAGGMTLDGGDTVPVEIIKSPGNTQPAFAVPTAINIGGHVVPVGSSATLAGGAVVTAEPSGIAVDGTTIAVPAAGATYVNLPGSASAIPVAAVAGSNADPYSSSSSTSLPSSISIGGTVIPLNGATTLPSGQTVTFSSAGVQIGGKTYAIPLGATSISVALPDGSMTALTAGPTMAPPLSVVVGGQTISLGSSIEVDGQTVSYTSQGITVAGKTYPIPVGQGQSSIPLPNGSALSVEAIPVANLVAPSSVEIAGTTIQLGGTAVLKDGMTVSYGSVGLIIGSQTFAAPIDTSSEVVTGANGQTYTVSAEPAASEVAAMMGALAGALEGGLKKESLSTKSLSTAAKAVSSSLSSGSGGGNAGQAAAPGPSPTGGAADSSVASLGGLSIALFVAMVLL